MWKNLIMYVQGLNALTLLSSSPLKALMSTSSSFSCSASKFSLILSFVSDFGMTATPLAMFQASETCAVVTLYLSAICLSVSLSRSDEPEKPVAPIDAYAVVTHPSFDVNPTNLDWATTGLLSIWLTAGLCLAAAQRLMNIGTPQLETPMLLINNLCL